MKRWTGRYAFGGLPVRMTEGELFCHLRSAERRGTPAALRDCIRLGEVWVCPDHAEHLYRRGLLQPEIVDTEEGDEIRGNCTGHNEDGRRCEQSGSGIYPAMPRCRWHEDQLPTRWDIEAEDEAPTIRTVWDDAPAPARRNRAAERRAEQAERAAADAARDWERLRRRGRAILAEARAGQGALALDA